MTVLTGTNTEETAPLCGNFPLFKCSPSIHSLIIYTRDMSEYFVLLSHLISCLTVLLTDFCYSFGAPDRLLPSFFFHYFELWEILI